MVRKRASFKPNLNQVRVDQTPAAPVAAPPPPPPTLTTLPAFATQVAPLTPPLPARIVAPTVPSISTTTSAPKISVGESIPLDVTRLTGLRNSAYKNVKLKDLLFFNPPLTKDQKRHKKNERKRLSEEQANDAIAEVDVEDSNKIIDGEIEEPSLVPKVKLGPEGQLILDESSTVINRKNSIKNQEAIVEDNEEIVSRTNYDSYRRRPTSTNQTKWSIEDTQKFYHALSILGTDFSMMESLLFSGHRSRTELHKKFKREERINKAKIDVALSKRISLNSEELDGLKDIFYKC